MLLLSSQEGDPQQSSAAPGTTCFRDRGWYFGIDSKATLSVSLSCFCSARDCNGGSFSAICKPRSIPNTGDHKGVIFQSRPVRLLLGRPSRSSRERRETSESVWPSLTPASSGAALWGGHNCGLYNMGYCWCWLVTLDEAFKEFSLSCLVSIKILQWQVKAWFPDARAFHTLKLGGTV